MPGRMNIDVLPKFSPEYTQRTESVPMVEVYPGAKRAGTNSISAVSTYLIEHHGEELNDMTWFNGMYGDRYIVIEGSIQGWKDIGEKPQTISVSADVPEIGIMVDLAQHKVDFFLDKWVADVEYHGPSDKFGRNLSKAETLRQDYLNSKQTPEYQKFVKFLKSKGYDSPKELEQIIVGFMGPNQGEGVSKDRKSMGVNINYAKLIEAWAKEYGVDPAVMSEYIIGYHQTAHRAGVEGTRKAERELESLIAEFFETLASKEYAGPIDTLRSSISSQRQKYLDIARKIASKRYQEVNENYPSVLASLFQSYFKEAIEDGKTEQEALDYAMNKVAEKAEKSEKSDKGSKKYDKGASKSSDKKDSDKDSKKKDSDSEENEDSGEESEEEGSEDSSESGSEESSD